MCLAVAAGLAVAQIQSMRTRRMVVALVRLDSLPCVVVGQDRRIRETILGFQKAKLEELAFARSGNGGHPLFQPDEKVPELRPG